MAARTVNDLADPQGSINLKDPGSEPVQEVDGASRLRDP